MLKLYWSTNHHFHLFFYIIILIENYILIQLPPFLTLKHQHPHIPLKTLRLSPTPHKTQLVNISSCSDPFSINHAASQYLSSCPSQRLQISKTLLVWLEVKMCGVKYSWNWRMWTWTNPCHYSKNWIWLIELIEDQQPRREDVFINLVPNLCNDLLLISVDA